MQLCEKSRWDHIAQDQRSGLINPYMGTGEATEGPDNIYTRALRSFRGRKDHAYFGGLLLCRIMGKQIRQLTSSCDVCQKTKQPNRRQEGEWQAIIPQGPRDLYAVDLYGPLPKTKFGNQYYS